MVALKLIPALRKAQGMIRSRNAVVALKQDKRGWGDGELEVKQERRGGIETSVRVARHKGDDGEAGTPWWH